MSRGGTLLRVLSWNVHGCVGRNGVRDPDRVAAVLEAVEPDVAALQEIDSRSARAVARDLFAYFEERFGWRSVVARTISAKDGHYGHIVLSRWPLESLGTLDLTVPRFEPRMAIFGAVSLPDWQVTIMAVHLGLWWPERRKQYALLKERLAALPRPIVALGDFNDFPGRGLAERNLTPPLEGVPALATFPSRFPLLPLDRIWYSEPLELVSFGALHEAGHLSDHLPLVASLRLPATAQAGAEPPERGLPQS